MRGRSERDGDRGAVAVEFALIIPIFLLFVYGSITFGIALSVKQMVSQAAAEGARSSVGAQIIAGDADQNAAYVRVAVARASAAFVDRALWQGPAGRFTSPSGPGPPGLLRPLQSFTGARAGSR